MVAKEFGDFTCECGREEPNVDGVSEGVGLSVTGFPDPG